MHLCAFNVLKTGFLHTISVRTKSVCPSLSHQAFSRPSKRIQQPGKFAPALFLILNEFRNCFPAGCQNEKCLSHAVTDSLRGVQRNTAIMCEFVFGFRQNR
jgi:hypothetical protein